MDTRSGFKIATIAGIPIRIHVTLLVVLPFLALAFGRSFVEAARVAEVPPEAVGGPPWLWGLGVALALFSSVLLHELAHSLYALRKGGRVRAITLLMIGGVSEMEEPPRKPREEALMALVGPVTSLALGVAALGLYWAAEDLRWFNARFALFYLAQLNLVLGVFNLLPAFPMDGGRILRGVLTPRTGVVRATRIAAAVGKTFAVLFAVLGFLGGNVLLLLVAFFVYVGAGAEYRHVLARTLLGELRVGEVMTPQTAAVRPDDSVAEVADRMLREKRLSFPVVEEWGAVVGLVALETIRRVEPDQWRDTRVRETMSPAVVVSVDDTVRDALNRFSPRGASELCVVDGGRLVGTMSDVDVARGLKLRELGEAQRRPRRWTGLQRRASA
jgi:Zn-dependent protease